MKKLIVSILVIGVLLSASATVAFAGCHRAGCYFVDADGDGVCDNSAFAQGQGCGFGHGGRHGGGRAGHGCGFRGGRD